MLDDSERPRRIKLLAVAGSLQARSSNEALVRVALESVPEDATLERFPTLGAIPALNPDLEQGGQEALREVAAFRQAIASADGVLIATPEYGHSMPGFLKNALDWLVLSGELSRKPVAIISASTTMTGGIRAQMALTQTLLAQAASVVATLTVPGIKTKLDSAGDVTDPAVRRRIGETLQALLEAAREHQAWLEE